jgi:NAD(P)-dependent dehydrogenase (short-subunit alcohol dehydrogenase family)
MPEGIVADKVAIVTGGGRGIGRAIALLLAQEGARVVVCDVGAALDGSGADAGPAQAVVDEIRKAGGEAIASTLSISEPQNAGAIVRAALEAFGRVDILVNNAGILRDRIFHKMSWSDWSDVIAVHLNGSFAMSSAVAGHFREQNSGSFVHMTSTSGLIGNYGQANYMAAKLGIMGLSRGIALDMARFNVRSNCIAPFAWSRMIGSIPVETEEEKARVEKFQQMTPRRSRRSPFIWRPTVPPAYRGRFSRCGRMRSSCSTSRARSAASTAPTAGRRSGSTSSSRARSRPRSHRSTAPATCSRGIRCDHGGDISCVMAGLVPAIHVFFHARA